MVDAAIDEGGDAFDLVFSKPEFRGYFCTTQKIQSLGTAELEAAVCVIMILLCLGVALDWDISV